MIEKLGGRKVFLGVFVMLIGVLVDSIAKNGLSPNLLDLLKFIGVGFFLGNGIEHVAVAVKDRASQITEIPEPVDLSEINGAVDELKKNQLAAEKKIDELMESSSTTQQGISYIITAAGFDQSKADRNRAAIR